MTIRVLVLDDEVLAAEAHASYLSRLDDFELAAVAHSAGEAFAILKDPANRVDLVLLDLTLPDAHGLDLARRVRASRIDVDFIAITAERSLEAVHGSLAIGAAHFLIKPFGFTAFREKLEHYAEYRKRLTGTANDGATQQEVDAILSTLHTPTRTALPKGLSAPTLESVSAHLRASVDGGSASEIADALDLSRVTARRYLEHLADSGLATRAPRYGTPGRPEMAYRWRTR